MQIAQEKYDRLVSYLKDLAEMPAPTDDEEFCPGESDNCDDDFADGALDGKIEVARAVLDLLSVEYKKPEIEIVDTSQLYSHSAY